jgi:hypothetical protein
MQEHDAHTRIYTEEESVVNRSTVPHNTVMQVTANV